MLFCGYVTYVFTCCGALENKASEWFIHTHSNGCDCERAVVGRQKVSTSFIYCYNCVKWIFELNSFFYLFLARCHASSLLQTVHFLKDKLTAAASLNRMIREKAI